MTTLFTLYYCKEIQPLCCSCLRVDAVFLFQSVVVWRMVHVDYSVSKQQTFHTCVCSCIAIIDTLFKL